MVFCGYSEERSKYLSGRLEIHKFCDTYEANAIVAVQTIYLGKSKKDAVE